MMVSAAMMMSVGGVVDWCFLIVDVLWYAEINIFFLSNRRSYETKVMVLVLAILPQDRDDTETKSLS